MEISSNLAGPGQVLVVEDDPSVRALLLLTLDLAGHRTEGAKDGAQAIKLAGSGEFDLVVLDPGLPDTTGEALLAELRAMPHLRTTRFLILSGTAHQEGLIALLRAGAHDYLRKPFAPPDLKARVDACLRTKREVDRLLAAALHDPLTGLLNRRGGEQALRRTQAHGRRAREPMAVLMVDVEGFKAINDQHGHQVGDSALRHVADCLSNALRQGDLLCRWGGDEFLVVLPDTYSASAHAVAERAELLVRTEPVPLRDGRHSLSVTVGAAAVAPHPYEPYYAPDLTQLLARADTALYRQRQQPRDGKVSAETCGAGAAAPAVGDGELMAMVEVAALFGVCPTSVRRWAKTGQLPCVHLPHGRYFRPADVQRLMRETNPPGTAPAPVVPPSAPGLPKD